MRPLDIAETTRPRAFETADGPALIALIWKFLPASMTGPMARNSGVSLGAKMFALGAGFLYAVTAARVLGPAGYGIVAVVI